MSPVEWILLSAIVFLAGIVRGCIGFGFSALVVVSATLFLQPILVVPMLAFLEIAASLQMIRTSWRDTAFKILLPLLLATAIATPLGVMLLVVLDPNVVKLMISTAVLFLSLMLFRGWKYKGSRGLGVLTCLGLGSGICNGTAAIGGLPVAVFLTASNINIKTLRATLVIFFLASDIILLMSSASHGIFSLTLLKQSAIVSLPMFVGIWLGSKLFHRLSENALRRFVINLLMALSITGIALAII